MTGAATAVETKDTVHNPKPGGSSSSAVEIEKSEIDVTTASSTSQDATAADNIVSWDSPTDPENPLNWSKGRKWRILAVLYGQVLTLSLGSSIITPAIPHIAAFFKVRLEVGILSLSLYVLAWCFGPLVGSPLSEVYGRNAVYRPVVLLYLAFEFGSAFAKNVETLLVCRFLTGLFGSPLLTVSLGTATDMFRPNEVGPPMGLGILCAMMGPVIGPIAGGFIAQYTDWRWGFRVHIILTGVITLFTLFLPETFHDTILRVKVQRLRNSTGNQNLRAHTELHALSASQVLQTSLWLPFRLLFTELTVTLIALYSGVIYGILYLYFAAFPVIFGGRYHFREGASGAAFAGVGVGVLVSALSSGYTNRLYLKLEAKHGKGKRWPEGRLPFSMVAAVLAPVSIFWLGWSGDGKVHWIVPVLSGVVFAWSMVTLFATMLTYCADCYSHIAASAMAANAVVRCLLAGAFPLLVPKMYSKLEPQWAQTVLGFIAVAFMPVPFLFWRFGERIRARSRLSTKEDEMVIKTEENHSV